MVDDFSGELRELRDEDRGEPRAVGAFVAREAAGRRDRGEVRRHKGLRERRNSGAGAEKTGVGSCEITRKERIYTKSGGSIERRLRYGTMARRRACRSQALAALISGFSSPSDSESSILRPWV